MRYLKKFETFTMAEPQTQPGTKEPTTKPIVKPAKPTPFRRDKPDTDLVPKATAEEVANKFIMLMNKTGEDIKKYID
jgi:hypothetical protein